MMQKTKMILLVLFFFVAATHAKSKAYIVHTEQPEDEEPEEYHIKILASVLGSEDAAKEALIYSYKYVVSGFSAKLTPEQVFELSKKPGVLEIVPDKMVHLHGREP